MRGTSASELAADLRDARARSLQLVQDLSDRQLVGPRLAIVNPLIWEIGHLAWFQERWLLRRGGAASIRADADLLYDSFQVPHDTRWDLPLPSRVETLAHMQAVLDRILDQIRSAPPDEETVYFCRMVTFHEDMHAEAFTYARQTLGYPSPPPLRPAEGVPLSPAGGPLAGDVEVPGGPFMLGASRDLPFVFDNEKWAHPVAVAPFSIARAAMTQAEFARFVDHGGYRTRELWDGAGWRWREAAQAEAPVYWSQGPDGGWLRRHFDEWVPLEPHLPVIHVNRFEAEAYCRWAGRRLPSEAEWEMAAAAEPAAGGGVSQVKRTYPWGPEPPSPERASLDARGSSCAAVGAFPEGDSAFGCRQMLGNVWEWTASDFAPYPGFVADPYQEYSEPWFGGDYKVLRGGCWATRSRLIRSTWRNFYTPDRRDVFAGFRTCAL